MSLLLQKIKGILNIINNKPTLLIFNVTRLCNQHCLMCNIPVHSNNMTLEEISVFAEKFKKFGISEVYLQGGEPLLRKDILEIADIFLKNSIRPTIISNGELLNENLIKEIAKRNCNLSISIDSFIPELYAKLRGKDCLKKVLENLEFLKSIKPKGIFSVTSTVTGYTTLEDLKNIYDFCQKFNLMYYVRPYNCNLNKAGAKSDDLVCDTQKTTDILEYFNNSTKGIGLLSSIIYQENINFLKGKRYDFCDALKYSMVLNEDGKISPCIEYTDVKFDFDDFESKRNELQTTIYNCNKNTPCIYGCTRNVGFLVKNKNKIIANIFKLLKLI